MIPAHDAASSGAHFSFGCSLLDGRRWDEAKEHFIVAKTVAPVQSQERVRALFALGCMFEEERNFAEALKCFKAAISVANITPPPVLLVRYGLLKMAQGWVPDACELLRRAVSAEDFDAKLPVQSRATAVLTLAACFARMNNQTMLLETLSKFSAMAHSKSDSELFLMADSLIRIREWSSACSVLSMVQSPTGQFASRLGVCFLMLNEPEKAFGWFRRCLELDPRSPQRSNMLLAAEAMHSQSALLAKEYLVIIPRFRRFTVVRPSVESGAPVVELKKRRRGLPGVPWFTGRSASAVASADSSAAAAAEAVPFSPRFRSEVEEIEWDAIVLCNMGSNALRMGAMRQARTLLTLSVRIKNDCVEAHYNLGTLNLIEGRLAEAIEHLEVAAKTLVTFPVKTNYGVALTRAKKYQKAIAVLEGALALEPQNLVAVENLARAKLGKGDFVEAMTMFCSVFDQIETTSSLAGIVECCLFLGVDKQSEAVNLASTCVAREPRNSQYQFLLGSALQFSDPAGALAALRRSVALNKENTNGWIILGNVLNRMGEWKEAEASFRAALELSQAIADAHFGLGVALARQETKLGASVQAFSACVARDPHHVDAYLEWAKLLMQNMQTGGAVICCKHALSSKRITKEQKVLVLMQQGIAFEALKNSEASLNCFRAVLEIDPNHAEAKLKLY